MNTIANRAAGGALASIANLKAGLQNVQTAVHVKGGESILRMGKDGIWIYGADNIEVEEGSLWAANPLSLQHGFICWKKIPEGSKDTPELLGEVLVSMFEPAVNKATLPDYGHPWVDVMSIQLRCTNGADEGEQVIYKPSSTGGLRAAKEQIIAAIMKQLDDDPAHPVPLIELKSDHYQNKTWGKTYVPEFAIGKWLSMDGVAEEPAEPEAKPTTTTGTGRRAAPAPEPEPEQAEEPAEQPQQAANGDTGERRRRRRA